MKWLFAVSALGGALAFSPANAALLTLSPLISPNGVYSYYLAGETTTFNGIGFSVKPDGGIGFLNVNNGNPGAPRPAGEPFTYRNRLLDANPDDVAGGKGWSLLGTVNTALEITFNGGPIGATISTAAEPGGRLFLANIMLPPGATATATLQLVNGVDTVFTQTLVFPLTPAEPMSMGLAGFALIGGIAVRRRLI